MRRRRLLFLACASLAVMAAGVTFALESSAKVAAHPFIHVALGPNAHKPESGRLLLFAIEAQAAAAAAKSGAGGAHGTLDEVDTNPFHPTQTAVAAREVSAFAPGQGIDVDTDEIAFPAAWSSLPAGDYLVQAVLDTDHSYNYTGRGAGDLVSKVVRVHLPWRSTPTVTLDQTIEVRDPWALPASAPAEQQATLQAARAQTHDIDFVSPSLSAFWGRPITMRGRVLLPPGYDATTKQTWPTVYYTQGFGGNNDRVIGPLSYVYNAMRKGEMPPMIWVFLDESSPTGTHEFADSVNNGPWGQALTTELIPALEKTYRMDARAQGRFLNGHSSGGWATLWLQTRYPKIFGGTWSTSPDPSDFHDFTGVDLYAPDANVYRRADGTAYPLVRDQGKVLATVEQFAKLERVFGPYGGQLASFEWVFSPKGRDGRPEPLFDRDSGAVDPSVVAYWRDHYDIAWRLQQNWPTLKPDLDGKIHLYVGTADTFYLDGAAHRLKAVLDGLHANTDIRFLPGRTHFDIYANGKDRSALLKQIAWQMYALARPESPLKSAVPAH